ncbi:hypothetical protein L484_018992 [Morus notabilis]|uniref:Uncharacterized protein n=1 Tax=Morus notabilis TaxID=981085 RepID=W9R227_9ROSA|nr:hypothetical protein L484_018992 [Morus notabilis]
MEKRVDQFPGKTENSDQSELEKDGIGDLEGKNVAPRKSQKLGDKLVVLAHTRRRGVSVEIASLTPPPISRDLHVA